MNNDQQGELPAQRYTTPEARAKLVHDFLHRNGSIAEFLQEHGIRNSATIYGWKNTQYVKRILTAPRQQRPLAATPPPEPTARLCCPRCGCDLIAETERVLAALRAAGGGV